MNWFFLFLVAIPALVLLSTSPSRSSRRTAGGCASRKSGCVSLLAAAREELHQLPREADAEELLRFMDPDLAAVRGELAQVMSLRPDMEGDLRVLLMHPQTDRAVWVLGFLGDVLPSYVGEMGGDVDRLLRRLADDLRAASASNGYDGRFGAWTDEVEVLSSAIPRLVMAGVDVRRSVLDVVTAVSLFPATREAELFCAYLTRSVERRDQEPARQGSRNRRPDSPTLRYVMTDRATAC